MDEVIYFCPKQHKPSSNLIYQCNLRHQISDDFLVQNISFVPEPNPQSSDETRLGNLIAGWQSGSQVPTCACHSTVHVPPGSCFFSRIKGSLSRLGPDLVLGCGCSGQEWGSECTFHTVVVKPVWRWRWCFIQLRGGRESLFVRREIMAVWVNWVDLLI